ncbi:MAG: carbohydrate kinase, partial [Brooklawnia sp.]|nr:carbohydrate kinase [Brooklawnia sp.]
LALVACGEAADLEAAAQMMVTSVSSYEPNPANREVYRKAFDVYRLSRDAIRPAWPAMRELRVLSGAEEDAK